MNLPLCGLLIALLAKENFFASGQLDIEAVQFVWYIHVLISVGVPLISLVSALITIILIGIGCLFVSLFALVSWPFAYCMYRSRSGADLRLQKALVYVHPRR